MNFPKAFQSLTDFAPMKWQCRLFRRLVDMDIPDTCDIPTGLGKTSSIVIWLLALARQAEDGQVHLPRRIVYVVNRRTVVDQSTTTVEQIRNRLVAPDTPEWRQHAKTLQGIASVLCSLCVSEGSPLGISTLRGELADNEEWKTDPARPAVVVGTIDMIGSKLLLSGYGDRRYGRAHHAGLIGQDALIVHDEAHLTPAFSELLRNIAEEQKQAGEPRRVRIIELSATQRDNDEKAFQLEPEDETDDHTGEIVKQRLDAKKHLYLHEVPRNQIAKDVENKGFAKEKAKKEVEKRVAQWPQREIVRRAAEYDGSGCKVLIYLRTLKQVQEVAAALAKKLGTDSNERIAYLTGTVRGHERDALVKSNSVYRALLDPTFQVETSVYLVSTSAGEVGIDIDADHMLCDLTTLDSVIQRLGRVNRLGGEDREARVDVVLTEQDENGGDKPLDKAMATTLGILRAWSNDNTGTDGLLVSPRNLRALVARPSQKEREAAFLPKPKVPPLTDILLDNWSLTSINKMPARPEVAPFLHGLTFDLPETHVAWRREASVLHKAGIDEASLREWFRACRIEARETLRDRTDRVKKTFKTLLRGLRRDDDSLDFPIILLDERGNASWSRLSAAVAGDVNLDYCTVILPREAGGLDENGMLDPKGGPSPSLDVAEHDADERRRERWLHRRFPDGEQYEHLNSDKKLDAPPQKLREKERIPLRRPDEGQEGAETLDLVLLVSPRQSALENPETTSASQTLAAHTGAIVEHMSRIADRLRLDAPICAALVTGARWHDKGKDRLVWQRYARNDGGTEILAKARRYLHPRALGGYRHEFGSLLDAMIDEELQKFSERELVLHLIAAHHGWARPHFEPRSFDSSCTTAANDQAFSEVMRRFGQLQQRFGRWGLAWLESLVRCADIAASKEAAAATLVVSDSDKSVSEEAKA